MSDVVDLFSLKTRKLVQFVVHAYNTNILQNRNYRTINEHVFTIISITKVELYATSVNTFHTGVFWTADVITTNANGIGEQRRFHAVIKERLLSKETHGIRIKEMKRQSVE